MFQVICSVDSGKNRRKFWKLCTSRQSSTGAVVRQCLKIRSIRKGILYGGTKVFDWLISASKMSGDVQPKKRKDKKRRRGKESPLLFLVGIFRFASIVSIFKIFTSTRAILAPILCKNRTYVQYSHWSTHVVSVNDFLSGILQRKSLDRDLPAC